MVLARVGRSETGGDGEVVPRNPGRVELVRDGAVPIAGGDGAIVTLSWKLEEEIEGAGGGLESFGVTRDVDRESFGVALGNAGGGDIQGFVVEVGQGGANDGTAGHFSDAIEKSRERSHGR